MSVPGCSLFVPLCSSLQDRPAAVFCTSVALLQMAVLDYYLLHHLGPSQFTWLALDAINISILCISIRRARIINHGGTGPDTRSITRGSLGWLAWFFINTSVSLKTVFIFLFISNRLFESTESFFGPNTLKTTVALGAFTFPLLLLTEHDAPAGSDDRSYVDDFTGDVVFNLLDTVDIMDVLFIAYKRDHNWNGLDEFIMGIFVVNLILPTVPLFMLARSKFGEKKFSAKIVHGHRILTVLVVNIPNLVTRLLLWHGLSHGVSPFMLKNILFIFLTLYDIFEHNIDHVKEFKAQRPFEGDGSPAAPDSGIVLPAVARR